MKKIFISILSFLLVAPFAFSQKEKPEHFCGYSGISNWLLEYQANPKAFNIPNQSKGAITYVPMTVHIVGNDEGQGYFSERQVLQAFCTLNEDFLSSDIQFYLARDFNYINNSTWYEHDFSGGAQMMRASSFEKSVNTFFVADPAGNCGYFSPGPDALAVSKSCAGPNDHTWSHEVGHYLSLPHPFVGWEGTDVDETMPAPAFLGSRPVERVDGSNCSRAGDGFCDTEPDYISDRWTCNSNGRSQELIDPTGVTFRADGTLIMSYSDDACANRFSDEQIAAMQANLFDQRQDLLTNPTALPAPEGDIVSLYPEEGEDIPAGSVTLSWEPVKDATHYIVDVVGTPSFAPLFFREIVTETEVVVPNLTIERPHYWRVRPFNLFNFCSDYSKLFSFNVIAATSSANEITSVNKFSVSPIPAQSGSELSVTINAVEPFEANTKLVNLTGQTISQRKYQITDGTQNLRFQLSDILQGVYFFSLENETGNRIVKKIVVQ